MKKIAIFTLLLSISIFVLASCSFINGLVTSPTGTTTTTTEPVVTTTPAGTSTTVEPVTTTPSTTTSTSTEPVVTTTTPVTTTTTTAPVVTFTVHFVGIDLEKIDNVTSGTSISDLYTNHPELQNPVSKTDSEAAFIGWYLDANYTIVMGVSTKITKEETIYAKFETKQVQIMIFKNDSYEGFINVSSGTTIANLISNGNISTANITGYTFDGIYVNNQKVESSYVIRENTTIEIKYNPTKYTLTFMVNGEVYHTESNLLYNSSFGFNDIREPQAENSYFDYWLDEDNNKYYSYSRVDVTKDMTFTAKMEKYKTNVFFYPMTNEFEMQEMRFDRGSSLQEADLYKPANVTGKEFVGWYLNDLTTPVTYPIVVGEENIHLYAKFSDAKYTVTFMANGEVVTTEKVVNGGTVTSLPTAPASQTGEFIGWVYNKEAFTTSTKVTGNITVTAVYSSKTTTGFGKGYTNWAAFVDQESVSSNTQIGSTKTIGGITVYATSTKGRIESGNCINTQGAKIEVVLNGDDNKLYFDALWSSSSAGTITVRKVGETSAIATYSFAAGVSGNDAKAILEKTGLEAGTYEILTSASCRFYILYKEETTGSVVTRYDVTFKVDNTEYETKKVTAGQTVDKPTNPTKESEIGVYTFVNWYTDYKLDTVFDFNTPINANTEIYAKFDFALNKYNVTFVQNNEADDLVVEVTHGETVTKPTDPEKDGFSFSGWYTQNTGGSLYDFDTPVTGAFSLYARYTKESSGSISVEKCDGYNEGIYVLLNGSGVDYNVYYKVASASSYTKVDDELIRVVDTASDTVRCDILGLAKGKYDVKIVDKDGNLADEVITNVEVTEHDRSGYAHFGYTTGVGAYNDDGTLKENAIVIYVSEDNKNSVSVTYKNKTYTGIGNILAKLSIFDVPVDVRIFGRISAATWKQLTVSSYSTATTSTVRGANGQYLSLANYDEDAIINGEFNELNLDVCSKLNGLTNKIKYDSSKKEFDSYYNMMDISSANNVTIEGVGEGAEIFQWGFTWKSCNSIEVRNLTFADYTEDACSFEGSGSDSSLTSFAAFTNGRYWLHHNTFNKGKNYWDVCSEQDKHDGDGATDFKRVCYVTLSYNHYYQNHKTGLVGGSDSQMTACLTFHHNFYEQCQSRLPFARQANMHMYNNYYYASSGNNMQIYAAAYAFIENCYFENVNKTFTVDNRSYGTAAIKSYNNIYSNCNQTSGATVVTNRTDLVDSGNIFAPNFDTNSTLFYYDSKDQKSDVKLLTPVEDVKTYVPAHAGAEKYCS